MLTDPNREQRSDLPTRNGPKGSIIVENVFPLNPFKKWTLVTMFMYCAFLGLLVLFGWWVPSENPTAIDGVFIASWFLVPASGAVMLSSER